MKKLSLISSLLIASVSSGAMAGTFYLGPSLFYQYNSASHSSFSGLHPKLTLGYASLMGDYLLAGELFAIPFTAQLSSSINHNGISAKTSNGFGISFLPGMRITDSVLGYLRIGVISSEFTSPNTRKTGGQLGIGFATPISNSWDLRLDYIFTAYQSINQLGSVKANELGIGAVYKFDSTPEGNYKSTAYKS